MNQQSDELRYVPQRSTDQVYVQRRIGPTPFASALRAEPTDTAAGSNVTGSSVVSALSSDQTHEKMSYRMNYPMCVVRGGPIYPQDTVRCVPPSRSTLNPNSVDPRAEPLQIRPGVLSGPKPNPYWQKPPKSDPAAEEKVARSLGLPNLKAPLPRDTLHPLISSLQAEANMVARELHPEAGMLSNAKRDGAPCNAHIHTAVHVGAATQNGNPAVFLQHQKELQERQNESVLNQNGMNDSSSNNALSPNDHHHDMKNLVQQHTFSRPGTSGTNMTSGSGVTDGSNPTSSSQQQHQDELDNEQQISNMMMGGDAVGMKAGGNTKRRKPHDQRDALGRAYAPEGGLRAASEYSDNIQHFASSMPSTLTAIAAKALGRALHDGPVTTVPALHNNNASRLSTKQKQQPMTLPTSPAFRNLSAATRSILSDRSRDTRNLLEKVVCETVPLTAPAPNDLTQMMADTMESGGPAWSNSASMDNTMMTSGGGQHHSSQHHAVHGATRQDEVEIGEILRNPLDLAPFLCAGSALHAWDVATALLKGCPLVSKQQQSAQSQASAVLNAGKLRQITTQSASLFSSATSRPKLVQYLTDVGIRTGDSLYQILAPSQSDFTRQPDRAKNLRQFGNTSETPGNTYGFDNGRFSVLLENRGFDLEEVSLNGVTFLDAATVRLFGQYSPFLRLFDVSSCTQLSGDDIATALTRSRSSLRLLNFSNVDSVTGKSLDAILPNLKNLVALSMSGLNRLTPGDDFAFQHLCSMKSLRMLDISYCTTLGDGALVSAAQGCPCLEYIDMRGCCGISDTACAAIGSYCTQLRCWRISYCAKLTSASLIYLTRNAKKLEILSMDGLSSGALSSEAIFASAIASGKNLLSLSLAGTSNSHLKDESVVIPALIRSCPKLVSLDLSGSRNLTVDGLTNLIWELKNLRRLVLTASGLSKDQTALLRKVKQSVEIIDHEIEKVPPTRIFGVKEPPPPPPPPKKKK